MTIWLQRLRKAHSRVKHYAFHTPVWKDTFIDAQWDAKVFFKCEQFQPIGAFKLRGASNFCMQLSDEQKARGIVTHSSGNHAQAIAYMAHKMGMKAWVVMPENANRVKVENARRWGAEVHFCEPTIEDRIRTADTIAGNHGAIIIPPFEHSWIVEGQATAAMELIADVPDLDIIVAPLGGGGLLAGSALAAHYLSPNTRVIGAEPTQAADGYEGFISGNRVESFKPDTIADGLRTTVGCVPFPIIQELVEDIWLAEEDAIKAWMYRYWRETRTLIETSSAVPMAALDAHKEELAGKRIGIILTGGNVDMTQLP